MKRTWTIIGVADVALSVDWYQSLFGQPKSAPAHDYFGKARDLRWPRWRAWRISSVCKTFERIKSHGIRKKAGLPIASTPSMAAARLPS